jgi:hypothetical protein
MKPRIVRGSAGVFTFFEGGLCKVFWIEHGRPQSKYVQIDRADEIEKFSFAQIKELEAISEKTILKDWGILPR